MLTFRQLLPPKTFRVLQENLFYLFIILLPTQFGKHFWLQESLAKGIRIDYLSPVIYFLDLVVINIILLMFFQSRNKHFSWNFLFFLPIFIQAFWSETPINHICFSLRILILLVFVNSAKKNPYYDQSKIGTIFFYQSIFLLIISVIQIFSEKNIGGLLYFFGERNFSITTPGISLFNFFGENYLRPYSTFSHPNALAGYSLVLFFYTLYFNKNKKQAIATKTLFFLIILLTFSQNAWLFFILFLFINHITQKQQMDTKKIILTIIFSISIPFIMLIIGRFLTLSEDLEIRNLLFKFSFRNNYQNILLGGGWFSDIISLFKNNIIIKNRGFYQPVHNSLWFIILSIGILPLLALGRYFKTTTINKNWVLLFSLVIATGTFDHYWITQIQNLYLLAFLFIDFQKRDS